MGFFGGGWFVCFNRPREKEVMDGENSGWRKVLNEMGRDRSVAWVGKEKGPGDLRRGCSFI